MAVTGVPDPGVAMAVQAVVAPMEEVATKVVQ